MKRYSLGATIQGQYRDGCMVEDASGEWVKLSDLPEEKSTKPTEAEIDAAIKKACGKHRVLDSYTYEDVHAVVEAVFSPPVACVYEARNREGDRPGTSSAWCRTHGFDCPNSCVSVVAP